MIITIDKDKAFNKIQYPFMVKKKRKERKKEMKNKY